MKTKKDFAEYLGYHEGLGITIDEFLDEWIKGFNMIAERVLGISKGETRKAYNSTKMKKIGENTVGSKEIIDKLGEETRFSSENQPVYIFYASKERLDHLETEFFGL